jgi:hypothetical protein
MPTASPPADIAVTGPAPGEVPLLLLWTAVAIYGCVPETDQMVAVGLMIVGLLAIELVTGVRSPPFVHALAAAIVLWSGLYGATGRGSAVVGTWFAFWPLALVALVTLLAGPVRPLVRVVIGAIGGIAALAVARTGGIDPATGPALVAVAVAVPVSLAAAFGVVAVSRRSSRGASANDR